MQARLLGRCAGTVGADLGRSGVHLLVHLLVRMLPAGPDLLGDRGADPVVRFLAADLEQGRVRRCAGAGDGHAAGRGAALPDEGELRFAQCLGVLAPAEVVPPLLDLAEDLRLLGRGVDAVDLHGSPEDLQGPQARAAPLVDVLVRELGRGVPLAEPLGVGRVLDQVRRLVPQEGAHGVEGVAGAGAASVARPPDVQRPRVERQGDEELTAAVPQHLGKLLPVEAFGTPRGVEVQAVGGGLPHRVVEHLPQEAGPEVGLHDAVLEAGPAAVLVDEPHARAPGRGEPEVDPGAFVPLLLARLVRLSLEGLQRQAQGVHVPVQFLGDAPVPFLEDGRPGPVPVRPVRGAADAGVEFPETDLRPVRGQADARQRGHVGHHRQAGVPVDGQLGVDDPVDERVDPPLQEVRAQLPGVVEHRVGGPALRPQGLQEVLAVQVAGDLQVDGGFRHPGDLDHPVEQQEVRAPAAAAGDVLQGRLRAQRLQFRDGRLHRAQRVVRAGGDDEGHPFLARLADGLADQVVALTARVVAVERLLEAVGEDDDAVGALAQPAPDLVDLAVGPHHRLDDLLEPIARHFAEVQLLALCVAQPYGDGHGSLGGKFLGEADEERRLAGAHAADDDVRASGLAVPQVVHDGVAELVAPDHLVHEAARGLDEAAGVGLRLADAGPADPAQPPGQEEDARDGQQEHGHQHAVGGSAGGADLAAADVRVEAPPRHRSPVDERDHHAPDRPHHERQRQADEGDDPQRGPEGVPPPPRPRDPPAQQPPRPHAPDQGAEGTPQPCRRLPDGSALRRARDNPDLGRVEFVRHGHQLRTVR